MITNANLQKIFQTSKDYSKFLSPIQTTFDKYQINTVLRQAAFISQIAEESLCLQVFVENLNYSREGLLKNFSKYFNQQNVDLYARQPEKIANKVYANRMGNGDEASGDGWKYRGRGAIQITGKSNYQLVANEFNKSIDDTIAYLQTPEGIILSAGWYWDFKSINEAADRNDIKKVTYLVNGGYNGLQDRTFYYERGKKVLA